MVLGSAPIGSAPIGAAPRLYEIRAADTPGGKERARAYYEALGQFAHNFAKAEAAVQYTLWHFAKVPPPIARSIFSGTRIGTSGDFIRRICEATDAAEEIQNEMKETFTQLKAITTARDNILHYGALSVAEGEGIVTNALVAHTPQKIVRFPISPEILQRMSSDLISIMLRLLTRHAGRPALAAKNQERVDEILRDPWQYTPQPLPPLTPHKPAASERSTKKAPKAPPAPSRG